MTQCDRGKPCASGPTSGTHSSSGGPSTGPRTDAVATFELSDNGATATGSGLFEYWAFGEHAPTGLTG